MNRTLDQRRAIFAKDCVQRLDANTTKGLQKLPAMIRTYGLGQTLACLLADKNGRQLYDAVKTWLSGAPDDEHPMRVYCGEELDLINRSTIGGTRRQYQEAQQEALALAAWLKRFAEFGP